MFVLFARWKMPGSNQTILRNINDRRSARFNCTAGPVYAYVARVKILIDGSPVNPVPVSLARAMGADVVIAVDLNSDILGRHLHEESKLKTPSNDVGEWIQKLQEKLTTIMPARANHEPDLPSMLDVVASSINIMQMRSAAAVWLAIRRTSS